MKKLIKGRLEDLLEMWSDGLSYLITDDLISFYTFFTIIFAECAYLWAFYEVEEAIPFTIILLGYVLNVIVGAVHKSWYEGEREEVGCTILYVVVFVVLFIIGCFFNAWLSITMTAIPFAITAVWIKVRVFQDTDFRAHPSRILRHISTLFANKLFWLFSQFVVLGCPFGAFVICLNQIAALTTALKFIIAIVYGMCIPLIAFFEDDMATCDIFELAYDITWSREYEENVNKFFQWMNDKSEESD